MNEDFWDLFKEYNRGFFRTFAVGMIFAELFGMAISGIGAKILKDSDKLEDN